MIPKAIKRIWGSPASYLLDVTGRTDTNYPQNLFQRFSKVWYCLSDSSVYLRQLARKSHSQLVKSFLLLMISATIRITSFSFFMFSSFHKGQGQNRNRKLKTEGAIYA